MAEGATATDAPAEPLNLAPIAAILVIAGPVLVAVSSFLEWAGRNFKPAGKVLTFGGFEVPAKFVIDSKANLDGSGLPLGVLVLVAAAIALIGVLAPVPRARLWIWVGGALATVIPLAYLVQLDDFMSRVNEAFPPGGFGAKNTVGFGAVLCGVGGVVTLAGAALGWFAGRRS
ncbi:MAG TPA: hypothetical protein VEO00_01350 [Actinomycetota bacterium]|nr:hypothetical protein [Actinomycetota bacterium]